MDRYTLKTIIFFWKYGKNLFQIKHTNNGNNGINPPFLFCLKNSFPMTITVIHNSHDLPILNGIGGRSYFFNIIIL